LHILTIEYSIFSGGAVDPWTMCRKGAQGECEPSLLKYGSQYKKNNVQAVRALLKHAFGALLNSTRQIMQKSGTGRVEQLPTIENKAK